MRLQEVINEYLLAKRAQRLSPHTLKDYSAAFRQLTAFLGEDASSEDNRLRHTFAIWFLRNGGNIYALQRILGHPTLDMVKRYLALAQMDIESAHAVASPVKHWVR